ncbi:hypothetical protein JCM11641_007181 [Rhodosporidiobolus odoratus]
MVNLETFWTNMLLHGAEMRELLILCLPRWTCLTDLWLRPYAISGKILMQVSHSKELSVGSVSFSPATLAGPLPRSA